MLILTLSSIYGISLRVHVVVVVVLATYLRDVIEPAMNGTRALPNLLLP